MSTKGFRRHSTDWETTFFCPCGDYHINDYNDHPSTERWLKQHSPHLVLVKQS